MRVATDTIYLAGLDLGKSNDFSALSITEKVITRYQGKVMSRIGVNHLERWSLGTSYVDIAERVANYFEDPRLKIRGKLIVDKTGVGQPVMDILKKFGLKSIGITITSGFEVHEDDLGGFNVPKRDLVSALVLMYQANLIKVSSALSLLGVFNTQLEHFRVKQNRRTGNEIFEADSDLVHDDVVISVALPCWYSRYFDKNIILPSRPWEKDEKAGRFDPRGYGMS